MNNLPYLLTASLYLLLFYGCYELLLRRNTFFGLNRAYLLISVGLSLLLPLVELPGGASDSLPVGMITLPTFVVGASQSQPTDGLTVSQWLWVVYGLGIVLMLGRLSLNIGSVFRLIKGGNSERKPAYTLVRLPDNSSPSFSFGWYLVLNHTDSLTEPDALMRHEEAHIGQRHTADVLFLEIVQAVFWFNPVLWLYKRAVQEVHEFLADRAALTQEHLQTDYARQLVAYALNIPSAALTTPFVSKSTLKQRIVMLQKPQTHYRALLGYALVLPLAGLLAMCTQSERDQPQLESGLPAIAQTQARKAVKVDGEVFTVVEQQPEFQGGMANLGSYLEKNLRYPAAAQKAKAEGRIFVNFIVTKTGEITDVQLLKGIGYGADEEAIRVVQNMPRWIPARQNGQLVNVRYNLPINFQLEANESTAFKGIEKFLIDGKTATEKEVLELPSQKIARMDVNKESKTIVITTK